MFLPARSPHRKRNSWIAAVFITVLTLAVFLKIPQYRSVTTVAAQENPFNQTNTLGELKIYVITYLPEDSTKPGYLDRNETGTDLSLSQMRSRLQDYNAEAAGRLREGTRYKGYKNPTAVPSIRYVFHNTSAEYKEKMPRGLLLNKEENTYHPDFKRILEKENICDLVDKQGVRQVWLWGYHHGEIVPMESNMSMGRRSQRYWMYGAYGDISNSNRRNDLPICENTYVVFNYNMTRAVGLMLENHSHQFEHVFRYLDWRFDTQSRSETEYVFWGRFVGSDASHKIIKPGCGWTHYPPNGVSDYDWYNKTKVESDCMDWISDGGGKKTIVNCETWAKNSSCPQDEGTAFKVWWWQNMPGLNNGLSYRDRPLRNWWEAIYDIDTVLAQESGLYKPSVSIPTEPPVVSQPKTPPPTPVVEATPTPTPSPIATPCMYLTDINADGSVDIFDYSIIVQSFGKTGSLGLADINCDGEIGIFDLNYIIGRFTTE